MRARVVFLGSLRAATGRKELNIELPKGARISRLLDEISKTIPNLAQFIAMPPYGNLIIVNGVEIGNLKGIETPIVEDSEVILATVAHGGS